MSERWTSEQYQEYVRTGKEPESVAVGRVEKRVTRGRHHRVTVHRPDLGLSFASLTEERRYDWLVEQPEVVHVDVHPIFQLPNGLRYCGDFLIHFAPLGGGFVPKCRVEDVKGRQKISTAFRRLKRVFDQAHPFSPLVVVRWQDKQWKTTEGEM